MGGPGCGMVYFCDRLTRDTPGLVHLHIPDLVKHSSDKQKENSFSNGIHLPDLESLPSTTLTSLLMYEMNQKTTQVAYLISGYPRSLDDVVDYGKKIGRIDGAILIDWTELGLLGQMEYAAKKGQLDIEEGRTKVSQFLKNARPLSNYLARHNLLHSIHGERHPDEVYHDIQSIVGGIIQVDYRSHQFKRQTPHFQIDESSTVSDVLSLTTTSDNNIQDFDDAEILLPVVFVMSGPGSNKYELCHFAVEHHNGWIHLSMSHIIRFIAEGDSANAIVRAFSPEEITILQASLMKGDLVPTPLTIKILSALISEVWRPNIVGFIIDGFPRDRAQVISFEERFHQEPRTILIDCSELKLGQNLLQKPFENENFHPMLKKRLEVYKTSTLPMLKYLDDRGLLSLVDGDRPEGQVMATFNQQLTEEINRIQDEQVRDNAAILDSSADLPAWVCACHKSNVNIKQADRTLESMSSIIDFLQTKGSLKYTQYRKIHGS